MQQVTSVARKEGEESMNRGILDRYQHSIYKDVIQKGLHSHYHSIEIHRGKNVLAIRHDVHFRRHVKRKCDGNALHSELKKIKTPTFDGEKY